LVQTGCFGNYNDITFEETLTTIMTTIHKYRDFHTYYYWRQLALPAATEQNPFFTSQKKQQLLGLTPKPKRNR
jgi:hypothetical protein